MNSRKWRYILTVLTVTSTLYGTATPSITVAATTSKGGANTADLLNKASKEMGLSTGQIQQYMNKGFSLNDLRVANAMANNSHSDFEKTLANLHKKMVMSSKQLKAPANKLAYPAGKKPSGKLVDRTKPTTSPSMTAMTTDPADTSPTVTEQMDTAPYKVSLSDSNVSPLTGAVYLEVKEMTLYGKNGLDFDLTRSYSSDSAQFYDFNKTSLKPSYNDNLYMLGVGWSWNMSSIETDPHTKKKYLHYAGSGTYEITGTTTLALPSYPWKDLTIASNTQVTVGTNTSAYVLTSTKDGKMQYFDTQGRLIEIADKYGNWIQYNWTKVDQYDDGLADISNNIGNKISFTYDFGNSITITNGEQTVVLSQDTMNAYGTHVYMTGETDAVGRKTMYGYQVGDAMYSMTSTTPTNDNPYMLLNEVDHPTGAKTLFTYETAPVTRKTSSTSSNQVWRVQAMNNQYTYTDGTTQSRDKSTFTYTGDMGSSVGTTLTVSTNVNNGLTNKSYEYKRLYASANTSLGYVFYNTKTTETDTLATPTSKIVTNTYDTTKGRPMPTSILTQFKHGTTTTTGNSSSLTFDDYANVTSTTNRLGVKTTYTFDANTHLLSQESTPISTTETLIKNYNRNAKGDITSESTTDQVKNGTTTTNTVLTTKNYDYDSTTYNKIGEHVIDNGKDILTTYGYRTDAPYNSAYLTSKTIHVTDANNQACDVVITLDYDTVTGLLTDIQDGNRNKTHYDFDKVGRLTAQTNPDASTIKLTYHDIDSTSPENSVEETDETGAKKKIVYDPFGQKTETDIFKNGAFSKMATFSYDNNGNLVAEGDINPATNNPLTTNNYDAFKRKIKTTNPDLSTITYTFDDLSYVVTTAASDQTIKSTYDKMGNETLKELVRSSDTPDLTTNTYDNFNNLISTKDANGKLTQYKYDALNHMTSVTDANQNTTQYSYDARGNVTTITYPGGGKTLKKYDEISHLVQQTDPTGKVQYFFYDAAGNLIKQTDRNGQTITLEYNSRNQLTKKSSGNSVVSFEYDASGHRTKMSDETGDTKYTYNALGQLASVTTQDGKTMSYTYDAVGNVATMQDPFGKMTTYTMDSENHMQSVTSGSGTKPDAQYQFNTSGTVSQLTEGNGMNVKYSYNEFKYVTNEVQINAANATVNTFGYNYDLNNNQTSKTENGSTSTFGYDAMNQVISNTQFNETYTYDKQGNRLTKQSDNPAEPNVASYTYNEFNQLKTVTTADSKVVSYKYNGDGLMVERTVNGVTTRYYYDGDKIIAEANVTSDSVTLTARYIRGNDGELVAREDANGNKAYYLHNSHGDITELRDSNGNVLNSYTYDMWGRPLSAQETVANPFRYSGEYWDNDTNLQYLRARWYDPSSGRFINEDTVQGDQKEPSTLNLYTYVKNNPIKYWDPSGNCYADDEQANTCHGGYNTGSGDSSSEPGSQRVSDMLINFIEAYEGFSSSIYKDATGNPTIGYGHKVDAGEAEKYKNGITKEQAEALLRQDIAGAQVAVNAFAKEHDLKLSQQQFDSLVSFVFNCGSYVLSDDSTIAKWLENGETHTKDEWKAEFADWCHGNHHEVIAGLYNRRMDEFQMFWYGDYDRNYWMY